MKRIVLALLASLGLLVGVAVPANANAYYGCTVGNQYRSLHATATLINYGNNRSAVYVSATQYYRMYVYGPDRIFDFDRMWMHGGYGTKFGNPSQWGSRTAPLNLATKYVTVRWGEREIWGGGYSDSYQCTIKVGV